MSSVLLISLVGLLYILPKVLNLHNMSLISLFRNLRKDSAILRERPLMDTAMIGVLVVGLGYLVACFHSFALDDSFITYRYALNLAEGEGLVYNPGQRHLGTTAPFYAVLLASLHRLLPMGLPLLANMFSLLSLAAGAGELYLLLRRHGHPLAGMCAASLYISSPVLVTSIGMETTFCLLLLISAVMALDRGRLSWAGLLLGVAIITRPDAGLMAIVLGLMYGWHNRVLPWRAMLAALLIAGAFFLTLALYFGSPLPGSLAAKRAQMVLGFPSYAHGLLRYLGGERVGLEAPGVRPQPLLVATLLALMGGVVSAMGRDRLVEHCAWWIWGLIGWGVAHAVAYVVLGVPAYHWYYAPLELGLCVLMGLGLEYGMSVPGRPVIQDTGAQASRRAVARRWAAVVLLVGLVVWQGIVAIRAKEEVFDPKARAYRAVGEWLVRHTQVQDRVAVMEVGLIGYYSRRPMIDLLGLVDPPSRRALIHGDILWPIAHYRPEYVVLSSHNPFYNVYLEGGAWFYNWYRLAHAQPEERWQAAPINVYARVRAPQPWAVCGRTVSQGRLRGFRLLSYDLGTECARAGDWVELALYWRLEGASEPHLRVFSHVIDDRFDIYGLHDVDIYPHTWSRGEVVSTYHFLRLAPDMPSGHYYIEVGLYNPDTLKRLPVLDEEGMPTGAEIIVLQEIQVDGEQASS